VLAVRCSGSGPGNTATPGRGRCPLVRRRSGARFRQAQPGGHDRGAGLVVQVEHRAADVVRRRAPLIEVSAAVGGHVLLVQDGGDFTESLPRAGAGAQPWVCQLGAVVFLANTVESSRQSPTAGGPGIGPRNALPISGGLHLR